MNKTKVKIPAKVNLTLDIVGKDEKFHNISSLVATVNVYDIITIKKREDCLINLSVKGLDCGCDIKENNAYKAAKLFMEGYRTLGVDIIIEKNIPIASGMGGSSADIAGVLKGMNALFETNVNLTKIASMLGSDVVYMLNGGYAVISGKGDKVVEVKSDVKLPLIIITDKEKISSKEGYMGYDDMGIKYKSTTLFAVSDLSHNLNGFYKDLKNDLEPYAKTVIPSIKTKIQELKDSGAKASLMTGSGSAVYGVFEDTKQRDKAFKLLSKKYKNQILKCETV